MLSDGLRVAKYSTNAVMNLLDHQAATRISGSSDSLEKSNNATPTPPPQPPRRGPMSWRKCVDGSEATVTAAHSAGKQHWNAGATIKVGLNLADAASLVKYPGLNPRLVPVLMPARPSRSAGPRLANSKPAGKEALAALQNLPPLLLEGTFPGSDGLPQRPSPLPSLSFSKSEPAISKPNKTVLVDNLAIERTLLMHRCQQHFSVNDPWVNITASKYEIEIDSPDVHRIPASIAFMSGTVAHIAKSSGSFRERTTGMLTFPSVSHELLSELVAYLYWSWHKLHYSDSGSLVLRPFQPQIPLLFELMEAAVYFDLPDLVDICAACAATNADSISSFGGLLRPLVRNVLSRLSIGDLCVAEYDLLSVPRKKEKGTRKNLQSVEDRNHDDDRTEVDTAPIWMRNYMKVQSRFSMEQRGLPPSPIVGASLATRARGMCVRFYVEECMRRELPDTAEQKLVRIMHTEAVHLTDLRLTIKATTTRHQLEFWIATLRDMPKMRYLEVVVEGMNPLFADLFNKICKLGVRLKLMFACSDAARVDSLAMLRLGCNGGDTANPLPSPPGTDSASPPRAPRQLANLQTGWDPSRAAPSPPTRKNPRSGLQHSGTSPGYYDIKLHIIESPAGMPWTTLAPLVNLLDPTHLAELNLTSQKLNHSGAAILASLINSPKAPLRNLRLASCRLGANGLLILAAALRSNESLKQLDLAGNVLADDPQACDAARALANALQAGAAVLEDLGLSGNHLTTAGIIAICDALNKRHTNNRNRKIITALDFSDMDINASLTHLGRAVCGAGRIKRFQNLSISRTRILPRTFAEFCNVLYGGQPQQSAQTTPSTSTTTAATQVRITEFNMSHVPFSTGIATSLAMLLTSNSFVTINRLILSGAESDSDCLLGDAGVAILLDALAGTNNNNTVSAVRHLDLSSQRLGDTTARHLARTFRATALEEIILCDNLVGDRGVRFLQTALEERGRTKSPQQQQHQEAKIVVLDLTGNMVSLEMNKRLTDQMAGGGAMGYIILAHGQRRIVGQEDR